MHAPDKSSGKRRQKVELIFHFVDEAEIPVLAELMIAESAFEHKKRRNLSECQKSGGAGGTASCRSYGGRAPNPCAAAIFPQTSVALFAGSGGQLGVFRQAAA